MAIHMFLWNTIWNFVIDIMRAVQIYRVNLPHQADFFVHSPNANVTAWLSINKLHSRL